MKLNIFLVSIFSLITILFSCENKEEIHSLETKEDSHFIDNQYAQAFKIIKHEHYTEIQIINPENNTVEFRYGIGDKLAENITPIKSNLSRIIPLSATHIGMMSELNLLEKIVGVSSKQYLCDNFLIKEVEMGSISSIGDIGQGDVEAYVAAKPDLIIFSGFDTKAPILKKLKAAGITTFTNYDWKETHPLGRAEWLKVYGILFDKEKEANIIFEAICDKYNALKEKTKALSHKPSVLVGTMYGDVFNAPAGESYMAQLLKDVNVDYVYKDSKGVGSLSISLEEVITQNQNVDYWLNVAAIKKSDILKMNDKFSLMNAVKEEKVYSYYKNVNCFWEQSAVQPDVLLRDFVKIFHPELVEGDFKFYSKVD